MTSTGQRAARQGTRGLGVCFALSAVLLTTGASCYLDNPSTRAPDAATSSDADAADSRADGGERSLCEKYGGYGTVEVVVRDLVQALVADCRIGRFFTGLDATRQLHLSDCLVKQVAGVMRCPGIRYDVDNAGAECRDMKSSHKGLAIRGSDFDALIEDLVAVLRKDGVAPADIDAIAPSVLGLREDIVTNSAPGNAKATCDAGGGG